MSLEHPPATLIAGDDWILPGQLFAADGQPLSLLNLTLEWTLTDKGALNQIIAPEKVNIEIIDAANGQMKVIVPSEVTERLAPARYLDALRYTDQNDNTDTLWTGVINCVHTGFVALRTPYSLQAITMLAARGALNANATKVPP
jgi:hypothetical protein